MIKKYYSHDNSLLRNSNKPRIKRIRRIVFSLISIIRVIRSTFFLLIREDSRATQNDLRSSRGKIRGLISCEAKFLREGYAWMIC
jgi:hypothetical protein